MATTAPMMMPSSTEMLATKPLANLAISRIDTSTRAAMPMCGSCAYFGLGTVPTSARPLGIAGTAVRTAAEAPEAGVEAAAIGALA